MDDTEDSDRDWQRLRDDDDDDDEIEEALGVKDVESKTDARPTTSASTKIVSKRLRKQTRTASFLTFPYSCLINCAVDTTDLSSRISVWR